MFTSTKGHRDLWHYNMKSLRRWKKIVHGGGLRMNDMCIISNLITFLNIKSSSVKWQEREMNKKCVSRKWHFSQLYVTQIRNYKILKNHTKISKLSDSLISHSLDVKLSKMSFAWTEFIILFISDLLWESREVIGERSKIAIIAQ